MIYDRAIEAVTEALRNKQYTHDTAQYVARIAVEAAAPHLTHLAHVEQDRLIRRAERAEADVERFKSLYEGAMMYQGRAHDLAERLADALRRCDWLGGEDDVLFEYEEYYNG